MWREIVDQAVDVKLLLLRRIQMVLFVLCWKVTSEAQFSENGEVVNYFVLCYSSEKVTWDLYHFLAQVTQLIWLCSRVCKSFTVPGLDKTPKINASDVTWIWYYMISSPWNSQKFPNLIAWVRNVKAIQLQLTLRTVVLQ
jgi:hypothetical protein